MNVLEGAYGKITLELTIYEVVQSDFGMYECRASNSFEWAMLMLN